jgi:hypothetical protein
MNENKEQKIFVEKIEIDRSGNCSYCNNELAKGNIHFPPHDASDMCESGKRNHCTCDMCW